MLEMPFGVKNSLIRKVVIFLAFVFLVFFFVIGYLNERILENEIVSSVNQSLHSIVEDKVSRIDNYFKDFEAVGRKSADLIVRWLSEKPSTNDQPFNKKYTLIDGAIRSNIPAFGTDDVSGVFLSNLGKLNDEVKHIISSTEGKFDNYARGVIPNVFNMYLITKHQLIRIYRKDWALEIEPNHDFTKDIFYNIADPNHDPERVARWTSPYYDSIWKHWMTSLITPIYVNGEYIGIVGHDVILDDIYSDVLDKRYFETGYGFIFDKQANIIVHPEYLDKLLETAEMGTLLKTANFGDQKIAGLIKSLLETADDSSPNVRDFQYGERDESMYAVSSSLKILDWCFAIVVPESEVLKGLEKFRSDYILGALITSVFLFGSVIFIVLYYVINPIKKLTSVTRDISNGQFDKRVSIESGDEIGVLGDSFNEMTRTILTQMHEIKEAEEKYKSIYDNAIDGIIQTSVDGTFISANPSAAKLLGYSSERELISDVGDIGAQVYVNLNDRYKMLELIKTQGKIVGFEIELVIKNGTKIWISANLRGVKDEKEELQFIEGFITDITARKLAEENLKFSNTLLQTQLESSKDGILVVDHTGKMISFNKRFVDMWGIPEEVVESRSDDDALKTVLSRVEYPEQFIEKVRRLYSHPKEKSQDEITLKNGVVFERFSTPLISMDGRNYGRIWFFMDITEKRKNEQALIEAKDKAERSDRLKSEFLAQVSHEIRTPINAILSFSGLIKEELENSVSEEIRTGFTAIRNAGRRIIRTIDLILNVSEVQSGSYEYSPKFIDVYDEIILRIYAEYKYLATEKQVKLVVKKETDDCMLLADEYTVTQIIQNLTDNAIKYTSYGKVELEVARNENNQLTIKVSDTGIGISEEYLPHVFTAFTQEEQGYTRKFEGNGLGLALVNKYCEMNNADITVESKKNLGSVFKITFKG